MTGIQKILIIGAGPAGIAAALELHRRDIPFVIAEQSAIGGLARNANLIRNYPGFPDGIAGQALADILEAHIKSFGIGIVRGAVSFLAHEGNAFNAMVAGDEEMFAAVIVATGTMPVEAMFHGVGALLRTKKLLYEIGSLPNDMKNAVIFGGGDVAHDYALSLAARGIEITILSRSAPSAIPFLQQRAKEIGITVISGEDIDGVSINENGKVVIDTDNDRFIETDAMIVAIGRQANRTILSNFRKLEIFPDGSTSVRGIFLAGDVLHPEIRQVGTAVGDGIRAACMAAEYIEK